MKNFGKNLQGVASDFSPVLEAKAYKMIKIYENVCELDYTRAAAAFINVDYSSYE